MRLHRIPTVDSWIRDYGPNFLVRSATTTGERLAFNDWGFNAWGGKYETLMADDARAGAARADARRAAFRAGLVLEGGSIDVNGAGVVMTTEQCLLNRIAIRAHRTRGDRAGVARLPRRERRAVARRRRRRRRYRRPHRRHRALRLRDDDRHRRRRGSGRREPRAAARTTCAACELARDRARPRAIDIVTLPMPGPCAAPDGERAAGQLRQFLHRQQRRAAAGLRPRQRSRARSTSLQRAVSRPPRRARSTASRWCGAWAPSTASRSSSRA